MNIKIGIADDHQLFLKSLSTLINTFPGYEVVVEGLNGKELLHQLEIKDAEPDILLIDVDMPVMNGVATVQEISNKYPVIKMVALSIKDDDATIINMLKAGCCAYLLKDIHPNDLEKALSEIYSKGYYNSDASHINYRRLIVHASDAAKTTFNKREMHFLQLACSDLTYKQIASEMHLSERTIDGYRESLFQKLNVQSRVGMAMEAIRRNLVSLK
jgi:DNA-binding NarL/FixJ family response regulator